MLEEDIKREEPEIPVVEEIPSVEEIPTVEKIPTVEEIPMVEPARVFTEKTDEEYLSEINRLQEEYKQYQKAKKEAEEKKRREEAAANSQVYYEKRGPGTFVTVMISVSSSLLIFVMLFCALAFLPTKDTSVLSKLFGDVTIVKQENSTIIGTPGDSTDIGGTTIKPGDNVTITPVETDSIASAVYAKVFNSVVGIEVTKVEGGKWNQTEIVYSQGSGIIYSSDGIIVTNYHVIEAAVNPTTGKLNSSFNIYAYFDTKLTQYSNDVELIGFDKASDIAVLKYNVSGLTPLEFADSDEVVIGEPAVAIGSPGGLDFMNSVSEGIISGKDRAIAVSNTEIVYDLIQTTAAINPGNSGGALLNSEGKLLGICAMKLSDINYEGMGFAISSNAVKKIVESIRLYGYYNKPVLGVTIDTTYDMALAQEKGWPLGAAVAEVSEGSCAANSGIKKNDIITKIEDTRIETFVDLRTELLSHMPGDTITIEVFRIDDNKTITIQVTLDGTK